MISKRTIFAGLFPVLFALLIALPSAVAAETGLSFKQLDPNVRAAVQKALTAQVLEALGYRSAGEAAKDLSVEVTRGDCPSACAGDVKRGLCLCKPGPQADCAQGTAPARFDGTNWCTAMPDTATLFASEGGLGTTRVSVSLR